MIESSILAGRGRRLIDQKKLWPFPILSDDSRHVYDESVAGSMSDCVLAGWAITTDDMAAVARIEFLPCVLRLQG